MVRREPRGTTMREFQTAVAIVLLFTSTFVFAQKVTVEYDKAADFSQCKSHAWVKGQDAQRPGVHLAIVGAIKYALQQQRLTKTAEEKVNLLVRYFAKPDMEFNVGASDPTYSATGGIPLPASTPWSSGVRPPRSSASASFTGRGNRPQRAHRVAGACLPKSVPFPV